MKPIRHRLALVVLSVPLTAVLVACGAGAGAGSDAGSSAADRAAGGSTSGLSGTAPEPASLPDSAGTADSAKAAADAVIQRAVIATGQLSLTTRHLSDVRDEAIGLVTGLGGHVADEQARSDSHGRPSRVDLTLRVPAASFEKALDALGRLGTVRSRQQSVEDVTTQVIDIEARVKAQAASVASIQRLLARATTIAEIMSIESQLASRQAELDSLTQQQKWLADQTSMSTLQLSLTRPAETTVTHTGFLGGLDRGWHALGRSTVAVGTAVGATLPFAAVLALIGLPVWALVRRRRAPLPGPTPEA